MYNGMHTQVAMGFTEQIVPAGTHICLIYTNEEERRDIIGKFIKRGLRSSEKVHCYTNNQHPDAILNWLRNMGGSIQEGMISDQFSVWDAMEIFCPRGEFKPEAVYEHLRTNYEQAFKGNYPGIRISIEMPWALQTISGTNQLMEFEAKLNRVLLRYPITAICQYNEKEFGRSMILNVLKNHPMMIIGGQIIKNPYYLKPDEFLQEIKPFEYRFADMER